MNKSSLEVIKEFELVFKEILGIYLDTLMGFQLTVKNVQEELFKISVERNESVDKINLLPFRHTMSFSESIHEETLGTFIQRMSKCGKNEVFAANMCIVSVFNYWEDHYRKVIAQALNIKKDDLRSDVLGDMRLLRNSIVHHRAIALEEITKCKLITSFKKNDPIELTKENVIFIIRHLEYYTARLKSEVAQKAYADEVIHYEIGLALYKEDHVLAKYHFEEAIKINSRFINAYSDYANLLFKFFND